MKITQKNTRVTEFKTTGAPLVALPRRLDFETTIETDFEPVEIIAIRPDGASESTNPEALKMRQDGVKKRDQASENLNKARATALANRSAENARLKVELECSNDDFRQLEAMKGRLESELKAANDELQKRPPLATRGQLEQTVNSLLELSAINVENYHNAIQAKAELDRLKTQFSPPKPIFNMTAQTVYGMSLEEVGRLKADRHELRLALEKANRKLSHIKQTLG